MSVNSGLKVRQTYGLWRSSFVDSLRLAPSWLFAGLLEEGQRRTRKLKCYGQAALRGEEPLESASISWYLSTDGCQYLLIQQPLLISSISELTVSSPSHSASGQVTAVSYQLVEDALEHLSDYVYLGKHPLASLHRMPDSSDGLHVSHIERGKALSRCLQDAIKRLGPQHDLSSLSREGRYFDILYRCYVEGEKNDAVARKMGIADRTFYRHRRRAIEVVTQILDDLNRQARPK